MPEEAMLKMDLTLREAVVIKFLRDTHAYGKITVMKRDGQIERIQNEELHTVTDLAKVYGLAVVLASKNESLDKPVETAIVE